MSTPVNATQTTESFVGEMAAFIRRHELLAPGAVVVVAVSGGADSVALAAGLRSLGGCALHFGHVHHGLRAEAEADADFVAALAGQWGIPFHLERIDTPALARTWGVGIEQAARRGRYDALRQIARQAAAQAVAAAHHADDQVETILHRIVRGTHLRGLAGMSPKRQLADGIRLVRPLLWARREQIEQFCRARGLTWRTDRTNAVTDFTRNFIRAELLPVLRDRLNVRADEALLRLACAAGEAEATLEELAGRLFERACRKRSPEQIVLRLAPLRKAPPLLTAMALRAALAALGAPEQELSYERFNDLLAVVSGGSVAVDLPGGGRAESDGRRILLTRSARGTAEG